MTNKEIGQTAEQLEDNVHTDTALSNEKSDSAPMWVIHSAIKCMLFVGYLIRRQISFSVTPSWWDKWDDNPNHHGPSEGGTDYLVRILSHYIKDPEMLSFLDLIARTPSVREWEAFQEKQANKQRGEKEVCDGTKGK